MNPPRDSFTVGVHLVGVEQLEKNRFLVTVDGQRFASFCSESRARSAGRREARRLAFVVREGRGGTHR